MDDLTVGASSMNETKIAPLRKDENIGSQRALCGWGGVQDRDVRWLGPRRESLDTAVTDGQLPLERSSVPVQVCGRE